MIDDEYALSRLVLRVRQGVVWMRIAMPLVRFSGMDFSGFVKERNDQLLFVTDVNMGDFGS